MILGNPPNLVQYRSDIVYRSLQILNYHLLSDLVEYGDRILSFIGDRKPQFLMAHEPVDYKTED